jgi:hypothetical protein
MIPMSANRHVAEAKQVIVAMASMGRELAPPCPVPAVPKVTESGNADMTLVMVLKRAHPLEIFIPGGYFIVWILVVPVLPYWFVAKSLWVHTAIEKLLLAGLFAFGALMFVAIVRTRHFKPPVYVAANQDGDAESN